MAQKTIPGNPKLAEAIKSRRHELRLTIEEAAQKAGVGTQTWCRYEAGESIRQDKCKGVCRALNWDSLAGEEAESGEQFDLGQYQRHEAWSPFLAENFGIAAAVSFVVGSDLLLDAIQEDLEALAALPRGSHIGQISASWLDDLLPPQFLMRYDYEFLYSLRAAAVRQRVIAPRAVDFSANSVLERLALYLAMEKAEVMMEIMVPEMEVAGVEGADEWNEWIFDLFGDADLEDQLYSDIYLTPDYDYHFDHWLEEQF